MIGFLLMMQLSTALVVEQIQTNEQGTVLVLRNASQKTITAFRYQQNEAQTNSKDLRNVEGIAAGATYLERILTATPDEKVEPQILGIVFADGTTEGSGASVLLAVRDGVRQAEEQTARQVRNFLQFNTVLDDPAIAALNRELEVPIITPAKWTTEDEKLAWRDGYNGTRSMARQKLLETKPEHRKRQLEAIGGRR